MTFDPPQRVVGLRFGQAGLSGYPTELSRAVLRAFDQNDLPMGQMTRVLPAPNEGITSFIGAAAVFPDQLIHRLELSYEAGTAWAASVVWRPHSEPVLIEDLSLCDRLKESEVKPNFRPPPIFGDLQVKLKVSAEMTFRVPGPAGSEPGYLSSIAKPLNGLPVDIDGVGASTDLTVTWAEGTTVKLTAPASFAGATFMYWRHSTGVLLGNGITAVPLTMLRDGAMTAVYRSREQLEKRTDRSAKDGDVQDGGRPPSK